MKIIHTFVVLAYKESKYLEDCLKSCLNQSYKSKVLIATTTDNRFIRDMAKRYGLEVIVGKHTNIGGDFDFAVWSGKTALVTVAHQDDIYDYEYAETMVKWYNKYKDALIIFSDYYEIRNGKRVYSNINLKIKRVLLFWLRFKGIANFRLIKRSGIRFGNGICCPAVTFVKKNCPKEIFKSDYKCNIDWLAWERLSKGKGRFIYDKGKLMGHRISLESTTTDIIRQGIRTKEDYEMFLRFWPRGIARVLTFFYKKSEKSNNL